MTRKSQPYEPITANYLEDEKFQALIDRIWLDPQFKKTNLHGKNVKEVWLSDIGLNGNVTGLPYGTKQNEWFEYDTEYGVYRLYINSRVVADFPGFIKIHWVCKSVRYAARHPRS